MCPRPHSANNNPGHGPFFESVVFPVGGVGACVHHVTDGGGGEEPGMHGRVSSSRDGAAPAYVQ